MTIATTDIYLLVIIVSTLVVGFFWGAVRSLMLLAGWLLVFLVGAHLKVELGAYLTRQWTSYPPGFSDMAAFGIIYVGLLLAAPVVIFIGTRGGQSVSRYQVIDDLAGALVAVFVAVLGVAGLLIILSTFYGTGATVVDPLGGPAWTANLYQSLLNSSIGSSIERHLVPLIGAVLGPILPIDVREVFG
ncbi:MAG: CvpA family protein [Candidatus Limnocylindrales bacterium]|jgi:uncharacterized membrane protein required for colicin V production